MALTLIRLRHVNGANEHFMTPSTTEASQLISNILTGLQLESPGDAGILGLIMRRHHVAYSSTAGRKLVINERIAEAEQYDANKLKRLHIREHLAKLFIDLVDVSSRVVQDASWLTFPLQSFLSEHGRM